MTDSLAATNLQKIDDLMATVTISEDLDRVLAEHVDRAKAALAAGDERESVAISSKVLERLHQEEAGA
ncbi:MULTISPECIES: hypothetical protein [unclassified Streptomyces]|uniref:hypothetical protein n=1 Tax=unclassified Streptomyces TaxID=2593676 RepID=UPI002E77E8C8|nr:hypothetical protein [Streptomyces sp. JV184]MEE1746788.1 hypothetical protein [Streptomyces sp. JV184]